MAVICYRFIAAGSLSLFILKNFDLFACCAVLYMYARNICPKCQECTRDITAALTDIPTAGKFYFTHWSHGPQSLILPQFCGTQLLFGHLDFCRVKIYLGGIIKELQDQERLVSYKGLNPQN